MTVQTTPLPTPLRRRWQWSLRTLLLLTAAIAAWTACWQVRRQSDLLRREIASMENVTRELTVDDPAQFAVIKQQETWHIDDRWHVYLPPGSAYRLKLALHGIDVDNFPEAAFQGQIEPGRHEISYVIVGEPGPQGSQGSPAARARILVDGESVIETTEDPAWNPHIGWSHGISHDRVQQLPVSEPLVVMRRRFAVPFPGGGSSTSFQGPATGVLLWIEADHLEPGR
jgi:hypothetical protein